MNSYSLDDLPLDPEETPVEMNEHAEMLGSIYKELGGKRPLLFKQAAEEKFLVDTSDLRIRDTFDTFKNIGFMDFSENYTFEGLTDLGSLVESMIDEAVIQLYQGSQDVGQEHVNLVYNEDLDCANETYEQVGDIFEALGKGGLEILYGSITDQNKPLQTAVERDQKVRMDRYAPEISDAVGLINHSDKGVSRLEPEMVTERGLEIYANIVEPDYIQIKDFFNEE